MTKPLMRNVLADLAVEDEAATNRRDADGRCPRKELRGDSTRSDAAGAGSAAASTVMGVQACHPHARRRLKCLGGNGYVEGRGCLGCTGRRR